MWDDLTGTCIPSAPCSSGPEACGPDTEWNEELGFCQPVTLSAECYFDTNGDGSVGSSDLLNFLGAYGQACEANLTGAE